MANNEKKNETVNENTVAEKKEEQMTTPGGVPVEVVKKHPVRDFFSNNKKKIAVGLGVAGAFGAGIIADKIGIRLPNKKETDEDAEA
jgi:hypothetical protein